MNRQPCVARHLLPYNIDHDIMKPAAMHSSDRRGSRFSLHISSVVFAAVAAALAVLCYAGALHNPFIFDDRTEILENQSIRTLSDLRSIVRHSLTRPVTNLSYAIDYANWGEYPYGYHLTNMVLHAGNVVLLFGWLSHLLRHFGGRPTGRAHVTFSAFAGSSLFAVHPMMTEAVGYVSGRAEVLCTTVVLGSIFCLASSLTLTGWRLIVARVAGLALFGLALGTKEIAVVVPAVVLLYDILRAPGRGSWRERVWTLHVPLIGLLLILAIGRMWWYVAVEHAAAAGFDWRHIMVELHVVQRYLTMLVFPVSQSVVHAVYPFQSAFDSRTLPAVAVVGGSLATAWLVRGREPIVTFGIAWLFLALVPSAVLILLASKGQPMAEHRVYLASCGFFTVCAAVVSDLLGTAPGKRRLIVIGILLATALATLSARTIARNRLWSEPVRLWADAARKAPRTWAAQYASANAYFEADDCQSAIRAYRRALVLDPRHVDTSLGMADCLVQLGRIGEAREELRRAVARVPEDPRLREALTRVEEMVAAGRR